VLEPNTLRREREREKECVEEEEYIISKDMFMIEA